ncbi:Uncharacterised protein [Mycobacteroides abscessus subsp. abscessus]|uniref:hypothetical protein n=1 Tax=Mycobacteroides abscessus TaxID=36809 RepID=UPI000929AFA3|nr:hypothetical protein [Mycobacteroides abscessus]SHU55459.1 Uncharacterised protein [Mycobacteroides abscessus subsp. abscessus]SHX65450.1 Uncharacterised protein [Mycobacteroides abscessus subsp. abscessus]SIG92801.1 Uncharacterised protein [Mycobacteroides abscessus subsp. abscessus]SKD19028.1 Uncharacterised protein [Mycobacteroides abscessus subsp. abscessus]SKM54495.1 Uncharacterised protein [Mycobacteroides abscessus subsp. abscessus]
MSGHVDQRFADLLGIDLAGMHGRGHCPTPQQLTGIADGLVLPPATVVAGLWRGKVFSHGPDDTVTGMNRIGVGKLELHRYRFTARVSKSLFADRDVVLLDHDNPANPPYIRRFHDELVQIDRQRFIATSHYWWHGRWRFVCFFALLQPEPSE